MLQSHSLTCSHASWPVGGTPNSLFPAVSASSREWRTLYLSPWRSAGPCRIVEGGSGQAGQQLLLPGDTPVSAQPKAEAEGKYLPGSSPRPPPGSTLPAPLLKGITHKDAFQPKLVLTGAKARGTKAPSWFSLEQKVPEGSASCWRQAYSGGFKWTDSWLNVDRLVFGPVLWSVGLKPGLSTG